MSDQATPQTEAADLEVVRSVDAPVQGDVGEVSARTRLPATEVAFPWIWALVGLAIVVVAVMAAVVTESQGLGLR